LVTTPIDLTSQVDQPSEPLDDLPTVNFSYTPDKAGLDETMCRARFHDNGNYPGERGANVSRNRSCGRGAREPYRHPPLFGGALQSGGETSSTDRVNGAP
jgi:hypothetical protein